MTSFYHSACRKLLGLFVATLAAWCAAKPLPAGAAALPPLHVRGNQLVDNHNRPVVLQGVCIPSLEWSVDGDHVLQSVREATTAWHARIIRVPLSQDFWLGETPQQTSGEVADGGAKYHALVRQVVQTARDNGAYTILDLHWSDRGIPNVDVGQHKMPDQGSRVFWNTVVTEYGNDPSVLFDLYNEPHDVSPDVWLHGGEATDHRDKNAADVTYKAVGLQELLDLIRRLGAKNVVIAGTLDWAYSTQDVVNGYALKDPSGSGVVYANHAYPFKGESVVDWEHRVQQFARKYPVIVSEFGSDPPGGQGLTGAEWVQQVVGAIQANHWSYTAWCFHPSASPCLLADWNYTPTAHFGVYIKQALAGHKFPDPAAGSVSGTFRPR